MLLQRESITPYEVCKWLGSGNVFFFFRFYVTLTYVHYVVVVFVFLAFITRLTGASQNKQQELPVCSNSRHLLLPEHYESLRRKEMGRGGGIQKHRDRWKEVGRGERGRGTNRTITFFV